VFDELKKYIEEENSLNKLQGPEPPSDDEESVGQGAAPARAFSKSGRLPWWHSGGWDSKVQRTSDKAIGSRGGCTSFLDFKTIAAMNPGADRGELRHYMFR
jgi:hypothetical protein